MAYSIQQAVSDGTLDTITLGIQYLQRDDVYMRIAGEETPQSGGTNGYTWYFQDNTTLKITPVVPTGVEVMVYRRTDADAMYNVYSQNAQFDEATIDENNQQLLFIAQEYLEQGIPGAGVETAEFVSDDATNLYYRMKLTDGSYTDAFAIPKQPSATFYNVGTFAAGYNAITTHYQTLTYNSREYSWDGVIPLGGLIVAPGSTPTPTGLGGWLDRTDEMLRAELEAGGSTIAEIATLKADLAGNTGGDFLALKPNAIATAVKRTLTEIVYDQVINVRWFANGLEPNWNAETQTGNDYTDALQKTLNYYATLGTKRQGGRRGIIFPAGHYKLTSVTIPAAVGFGLDFIGAGKHASCIWSDPSDTNPTITDTVGFCNFRGMSLFGSLSESGASTTRKAVFYRGKLADTSANVDVRFSDCHVGYADSFTQIYGRGCIFDCGSVAVYSACLIEIVADPSITWTTATNNTLYTGMRHYTVIGLRADVVSRIIKISGTAACKNHIHSIQLIGNDFAACDRLIDGPAATIRGAVIAGNNSLDSFQGGLVTVYSASNCIDSNNIWRNAHEELGAPSAVPDCITWLWYVTQAIGGLTITGTTAKNVSKGIVYAGAASSNVKITNNHFPDFATFSDGLTTHTVYSSPYNCEGLHIGGNAFHSATPSGTYQLFDAAVQWSIRTRTWANTAPWSWSDMRLRYTPKLLVNGVQSATTPTTAFGRYWLDDAFVYVDFMLSITPVETTGNLSISLPTVYAVAESTTITGTYGGSGVITSITGFSVPGWVPAPIKVNPVSQEAELNRVAGMVAARITAADKSGAISIFGTFKYRY